MFSEKLYETNMQAPVVVNVDDVWKSFQMHDAGFRAFWRALSGGPARESEFWALKGVSFEVRKGETVGIIGRNGSGKSTLLQIIAGTLRPTMGRAAIAGRVAALLELGSGFNPEFTGRENVFLNAAILGISKQQTKERLSSILEFADIGEFIDQPVKNYSSGMVVRLAFSVIAHVDAEILIVDEALSVGDAFFSQKCMRFLREFQKRGTLLFVSHDAAAVTNLCSRAIWLDQGQKVLEGSSQEVVEQYMAMQHVAQRRDAGEQVSMRARAVRGRDNNAAQHKSAAQSNDEIGVKGTRYRSFEFDPERSGIEFGAGGVSITSVRIANAGGDSAPIFSGGEAVTLEVEVRANRDVRDLIVGFYVKDRLGQRLFGDNTYEAFLESPLDCPESGKCTASFTFVMPTMPSGSYMIDAAAATGTQNEHTQQHWVHDALQFYALDETMRFGLIRIPMLSIEMKRHAN